MTPETVGLAMGNMFIVSVLGGCLYLGYRRRAADEAAWRHWRASSRHGQFVSRHGNMHGQQPLSMSGRGKRPLKSRHPQRWRTLKP